MSGKDTRTIQQVINNFKRAGAKGYATKQETLFAVYFLKYMHANYSNPYLITAVVAWLRQESGGLSRVIGNNPFNIRNSPFAVGYRKTRNNNGHFAIFKNLEAGARATAAMLVGAGHDWRGYWRIVKAARRDEKKQKDQIEQALSFLAAIAVSAWDASRYGEGKHVTMATYDPAKNHLIWVWQRITGVPSVHLPAPKVKQPKAQKVKPPIIIPGGLPAPSAVVSYLQPDEAKGFYRARHRDDGLGTLPE